MVFDKLNMVLKNKIIYYCENTIMIKHSKYVIIYMS